MLGWFDPGKLFDLEFGDMYVPLPDNKNALSQREIYDMKNNIYSDFLYYYDIWETYHFLGLPHGNGWNNEKPWLIQFLKSFDIVFNMYQSWSIKKGK